MSRPLTLFKHGCSHYQGSTVFPRLPGKRCADSDQCLSITEKFDFYIHSTAQKLTFHDYSYSLCNSVPQANDLLMPSYPVSCTQVNPAV